MKVCGLNISMNRVKVASDYTIDFLEIERPQPLSDNRIEQTIQDILNGKIDKTITDKVYSDFKTEMQQHIVSSTLNQITGLETFNRIDIINGCTQFIDNLYIAGPVQTLSNDYRYHQRLGRAFFTEVGDLMPEVPLIIAMPFPQCGSKHIQMDEILDECHVKNIPVHIDGAWVTCCRDIHFDLTHYAIQSVGISLSKGLGLGWNRIGLRWTKQYKQDSITIMNDYHMNNRVLSMIGLHFIRNFPIDYLWNTYSDLYYKICNDFNLSPTKSIYLALRDGHPVGLSPLIRYLKEHA